MKLMSLILCCCLALPLFSAEPEIGLILSGRSQKGQVRLSLPPDGNSALRYSEKGKAQDKDYLLQGFVPVKDDWSICTFRFRALESGLVSLRFCGAYDKDKAARPATEIAEIKVNGTLVKNGDFAKLWQKSQGGKKYYYPESFWPQGNNVLLAKGAAPEGQNAVRIDYANNLCTMLNVEAETTYELTLSARLSPGIPAPVSAPTKPAPEASAPIDAKVVRYGNDPRNEGDLYLPAAPQNAPRILLFHGGSWNSMDRSSMSGVAQQLAQNGYVVYNINYRYTGSAPWPAQLDDGLAALNVLRSGCGQPELTEKDVPVFVMGLASGGFLALKTGLSDKAKDVAGIVVVSGLGDLEANLSKCSAWYANLLGTPDYTEDDLAALSPLQDITSNSPPIFWTHSKEDSNLAFVHAEKFIEKAREKGAQIKLYAYHVKNQGHGVWSGGAKPLRFLSFLNNEILRFLNSKSPKKG